jgi:hypothetical protein
MKISPWQASVAQRIDAPLSVENPLSGENSLEHLRHGRDLL